MGLPKSSNLRCVVCCVGILLVVLAGPSNVVMRRTASALCGCSNAVNVPARVIEGMQDAIITAKQAHALHNSCTCIQSQTIHRYTAQIRQCTQKWVLFASAAPDAWALGSKKHAVAEQTGRQRRRRRSISSLQWS